MRAPTSPQSSVQEVSNTNVNYRYEETRLRSYPVGWSAPVRPSDLAAAGFYFTGHSDRARCFECQQQICHWQPGDVPAREHRHWNERCRFVRGLPCGNVPIAREAEDIWGSDGVVVLDGEKPNTQAANYMETIESSSASEPGEAYCNSTEHSEPEDKFQRRVIDDDNDPRLCKICFDNEIGVVFVPCGHIVACVKCAPCFADACPLCRNQVKFSVRAFFA